MTAPSEETRTQAVEVTCPGCFHPQQWDAAGVCPICHYRASMEGRSTALLPVGTQLKGYIVGEKLGQGGFGITYRGFDVTLKMKVAIKEYYPSELVGRSTDRKTVVLNAQDHEELFRYGLRTFLQEAQTIAQLRYPHLVRVLNYFELNATAYLVMDYYEGEDLARHLKPAKGQTGVQMPWRRALKLLLPVLDGLQKVHQAGFMHRDLKPGNLYLTPDDELIVLDFGSARQVTGTHTRSLLIFSEGYAPYEQYLQGHLNRQGPWTDIYGAAATLYFMLTAQRLPSALERKQAVLLQQPDPLLPARRWVPDLPPALDAALLRALAVEPDQRPSSIAEFKRLLEAALMAEEEPARPEPPPQPWAAPKPPPRPQAAPIQIPPALAAAAKPSSRSKASPPPTGVPPPSTSPKARTAIVVIAVIGLIVLGGWCFWEKFGVTPTAPVTPAVVAPPDRYWDKGDGTVTDVKTGLQWMRCSLGQTWQGGTCVGEAKAYSWQAALDAANTLNRQGGYAGYRDWRVPTREELLTLVYCSSGQPKTWNDTGKSCEGDYKRPALYQPTFPNTPVFWFWSSSPYAYSPDGAWYVGFYNGQDFADFQGNHFAVRLVRGGQ